MQSIEIGSVTAIHNVNWKVANIRVSLLGGSTRTYIIMENLNNGQQFEFSLSALDQLIEMGSCVVLGASV